MSFEQLFLFIMSKIIFFFSYMIFLTNFLFRNLLLFLAFWWLSNYSSPSYFGSWFFKSSFPVFSCSFTSTPSHWQQLTHTLLWDPWALRASTAGWRWERMLAEAPTTLLSSWGSHTGWKRKKEEQAEGRKWRRTWALCGCNLLDPVLMSFARHYKGEAQVCDCGFISLLWLP